MSKLYTVITGDLVKSREICDRNKVQKKLLTIINKVNIEFHKYIVVKFSLTLGDEFQGLINSVEKSYTIVKEIQKSIYPIKISFGIGVGSISTKIMKRTTEMDGECFVRSRYALQLAKETGQSIVYATGLDRDDIAINTIIMLMDTIRNKWKELHYRRIWLYEKLGTLEKVAQKENITKQMVSKNFACIGYETIRNAEETIINLLSTLYG